VCKQTSSHICFICDYASGSSTIFWVIARVLLVLCQLDEKVERSEYVAMCRSEGIPKELPLQLE